MKTGRAKMRRNRMWAVFLSAVLLAGSFSFSYGESGESGTVIELTLPASAEERGMP